MIKGIKNLINIQKRKSIFIKPTYNKMSVQSVKEIEEFWDKFSDIYITHDNGINVFYLSLLNMLKIEKKNNILEVAAGAGFLYDHTLKRINPKATYTATDISENMLNVMRRRLSNEVQGNNMTKNNNDDKIQNQLKQLRIEKANGEELQYADNTFDCYIANMCLQITTDPHKMLAESYRVLQKGGVAGFSVWGNKTNSPFMTIIPSILHQNGFKIPPVRSMFHLNDRENLIKMMENTGFSNVICWNQFSPFHHTTEEDILEIMNFPHNIEFMNLAGERKEEIKQKIFNKFKEHIQINKQPLGLDAQIIIGTKN